jgi:hypothetical protein
MNVDILRQHLRVCGYEQHIIEGERLTCKLLRSGVGLLRSLNCQGKFTMELLSGSIPECVNRFETPISRI